MDLDQGYQDIFEEISQSSKKSTVRMATKTVLGALKPDELASLGTSLANSLTAPGHMQLDIAKAYMARILPLFDGQTEPAIHAGLAAWAALHDVGAVQDFQGKPPIVIGTASVSATAVFGEIVPVTQAGEPRQFCATMFEADMDYVLKIFPHLYFMLSARCVEAGLPASDPKAVISFMKGVTPATAGSNATRVMARTNLLAKNATNGKGGAARVTEGQVQHALAENNQLSGHDLY